MLGYICCHGSGEEKITYLESEAKAYFSVPKASPDYWKDVTMRGDFLKDVPAQ